jgi:hypothetical protein
MTKYTLIISGWRDATEKEHLDLIAGEMWRVRQRVRSDSILLREGEARGVDTIAKWIALQWGWDIDPNHADWSKYGRAAGHIRNREMCAKGGDELLAFPGPNSKGTTNCIQWAKYFGIPILRGPFPLSRE